MKKFIDDKILPGLDIIEGIQKQLNSDEYKYLSLREFVLNQLVKYLGRYELDSYNFELPQEYESPTLSNVEEVNEILDIDVRQLSSGELLINFSVNLLGVFDIFVYKSDYYVMEDDPDVFIWDNDWNDWYIAASVTKETVFDLSLTFLPERNEITSVSIDDVHS